MTKLGIVTDVHSDIVSLDVALARMKVMGVELVVCAGDLCDGDVFPDEVIARLEADKIPTIRGNHDRWALERVGRLRAAGHRREDLHAQGPSSVYDAGEGLLGGGQELSEASLRYLASLPTSLDLELEGIRVAVRHARPSGMGVNDMVGIDPRTTSPTQLVNLLELAGRADVLLVGHTHERFAVYVQRSGLSEGLVANPGALWSGGTEYEKRGGLYVPGAPSHGTFGVLELPALRFSVYRAADGAEVLSGKAPKHEGKE